MTAQHARFPGESFISQAEFDLYCRESQDQRDARFGYERDMSDGGADLVRDGICAPCLRLTRFSTPCASSPDWRDGQICDCADRLGQRARAMLHFLEARAGLDAWTRVLLLGPPSPLDARLAAGRPEPLRTARLTTLPHAYRLEVPDAAVNLIVAWDVLHHVPPLEAALCEVRRALAPGGRFVFTLPFHYRAARTVSSLDQVPRKAGRLPAEFGGEVHGIGWDILDMLRVAGFSQAHAHHYWSNELGYLGVFNLLFSAST